MNVNNHDIKYLAGKGNLDFKYCPRIPYSDVVCDYLNALSTLLMHDTKAKQFPDVISFAFWCRKANIAKLKEAYTEKNLRLGLGLVFHIAPSNVPVNFAFSYAFSLLAGNSNIVRVPSADFAQIEIICNAIDTVLNEPKYSVLSESSTFIRYSHNDEITGAISDCCNARIIWGGDDTIQNIRKLPVPVRSIEIAFADRYSFCAIDSKLILDLNDSELSRLAMSFYNDTYLMDQNACSSPNLLVWIGNEDHNALAKEKFWKAVIELVHNKYELQPVHAVDKYTKLCQNSIDLANVKYSKCYDNYLYCMGLSEVTTSMDELRGQCGYFYEFDTDNLNKVAHIINNKYQTLTYFGIEKEVLTNFVVTNSLSGIDRIVPIGSALDISIIWDGFDLIRTLSRIVDIK